MDSDYDPQREAEAAMKLAMAVDGPERQHLVRLAMAWQQLARIRPTLGASEKGPGAPQTSALGSGAVTARSVRAQRG
jgi:hypothetical protein